MLLFNTKSLKKEIFNPKDPKNVKLYTCGPTVYDYAHIGNLRTYVVEDLLKRTLLFLGYGVTHVMNLTDVDDKTIRGALKAKLPLNEYTQTFKDAFFDDLKALRIFPACHYPAAPDYISQMIEMISQLLSHEVAYKGLDNSIYFSIQKFPNYGCLSHLKLEELETDASNRVQNDEYDKENASDFVLWKSYDSKRDGDIYWESPFGKGRPGWHLECSAMAIHYFGPQLDLHMGGVDNIFPHHENEIAQSEACTEYPFCSFWVHVEHLLVDNKKMSKSLGNFFTLRNLVNKGYSPLQVRYLLLSAHYKTQLNFTLEGLKAAGKSLDRLQNFITRLQRVSEKTKTKTSIQDKITVLEKAFKSALEDNLNISQALSHLFDFLREVNPLLDQNSLSYDDAHKTLEKFKTFNTVLALLVFDMDQDSIPMELQEALRLRQKARLEKNWKEADRLRDLILEQGYTIEDTPSGPQLKKNQ